MAGARRAPVCLRRCNGVATPCAAVANEPRTRGNGGAGTCKGDGYWQARDPAFPGAIENKVYYGPVYFRRGSEPYLTLGGNRVVHDAGGDVRELLLWSSRRLAALWRALEDRTGLRGVFVSGAEPQVVVTDLVSLPRDEDEQPDHGEREEVARPHAARTL